MARRLKNPTQLDEDRAGRERTLDETIAATFPASDPLSTDPDPLPPNAEEEGPELDRKIAS